MRIESLFKQCKEENRKAFVAYIAAGDPDFDTSLKIVDTLVEAGVDIIELGVPFSDPLADGEANQLAANRALESGMTPAKVIDMACEIRKKHKNLPIVLFTYLNPIAYSAELPFDEFCNKSVEAGIDALLLLDLPPEEQESVWNKNTTFTDAINNAGIHKVVLIAPTTPDERIPILTERADAFIYYVSREGVTGEGDSFSAGFADEISLIKSNTEKPVVVGFGISTPEHVKAAAQTGVDGVVVGSAIVRKIEAFAKGEETLDGIKQFVSGMTAAVR